MKTPHWISAFLLLALLLSACGGTPAQPEATTPTASIEQLAATSAALTVEAFTTQIAQQPTETPQPQPTATLQAEATATLSAPAPTATVPLILVPTNTVVALATSAPCDRAAFVEDVTVPDDTNYKAGETFTKTWKLKNVGTCTWSSSYKLIFKSGNALEGPASVNLPGNVAPNETVNLSVNLKAPANAGTYQGYYKLANAQGVEFGVGPTGGESFWVKIKVGGGGPTVTPGGPTVTPGGPTPTVTATPGTFAVTKVDVKVDTAAYTGTCPRLFAISADITVNRAGTVTYNWVIDGTTLERQSVTFEGAGTKTVTLQHELAISGAHSVSFYNASPNNQSFDPTAITVTCQ